MTVRQVHVRQDTADLCLNLSLMRDLVINVSEKNSISSHVLSTEACSFFANQLNCHPIVFQYPVNDSKYEIGTFYVHLQSTYSIHSGFGDLPENYDVIRVSYDHTTEILELSRKSTFIKNVHNNSSGDVTEDMARGNDCFKFAELLLEQLIANQHTVGKIDEHEANRYKKRWVSAIVGSGMLVDDNIVKQYGFDDYKPLINLLTQNKNAELGLSYSRSVIASNEEDGLDWLAMLMHECLQYPAKVEPIAELFINNHFELDEIIQQLGPEAAFALNSELLECYLSKSVSNSLLGILDSSSSLSSTVAEHDNSACLAL